MIYGAAAPPRRRGRRIEALGANEEDLHTVHLTVGFADIVSFTALSNEISEDRIGDLVEVFRVALRRRRRLPARPGDQEHRRLRAVRRTTTRSAPTTPPGIIQVIGRDPRMPDVRVGLATGSVVMRLGDVFGPPVNLAARLTAVARAAG